MTRNSETVMAIYDAFKTGNMPAILDKLADNVDWMDFERNRAADAGVPWFIRRRGKNEVPKFFQGIAQHLVFDKFEVGELMESGNRITAPVSFAARFANGDTIMQDDLHLWTFDAAGKVTNYRHYSDTAEVITRWQMSAAKAA